MEISKKELLKLYETKTNKELAKMLGVSETTLTKTLVKIGAKLKGRGKGGQKEKLKIVD